MQITRELVIRYLRSLGWQQQRVEDDAIIRVVPPETMAARRSILFSSKASTEGEAKEVGLAVALIEDAYQKRAAEIVRGILALSHDLILGKVSDDYMRNDTIELRGVRAYLNGMRGLIANAAMSEMIGSRFFKKASKFATGYADRCGFGHTFRGSFGLSIEAPLGDGEQGSLDSFEPVPPLGRRVITRIATGLQDVSTATREGDVGAIVEARDGMNAAMCRELVAVIKQSGLPRIDLSIEWSPEFAAPETGDARYRIEVKQLKILEEAVKRLSKEERPSPALLSGRIVDLHSTADPADDEDDQPERWVYIVWDAPGYGRKKVQVKLDARQYVLALAAHGRGLDVEAIGTLSQGRTWVLEEVFSFRWLNTDV